MPAVNLLKVPILSWANVSLLREDPRSRERVVDSSINKRNWRRYNRTVVVGPEDDNGCKRVTIEWDEDYEFEYVIVIEREPSFGGLGWGGGFSLGGRTTHRIGWFKVVGEHHRESHIECPGDSMLASRDDDDPLCLTIGTEQIWMGKEQPLVAVVTGGKVAPIIDGGKGHLADFILWMEQQTLIDPRGYN